MSSSTLWLAESVVSSNAVTFSYGVDERRFSTSYSYEDVDFGELRRRYGNLFVRKLIFHMAAFGANKAASLRPDRFDAGPYADLVSPAFAELWRTVLRNVWAQWRYENDCPGYLGPEIRLHERGQTPLRVGVSERGQTPLRVSAGPGDVAVLSFCGGGKDSLVAMRVLERAGIPYATYGYASSTYGASGPQHALIERLARHGSAQRHHRHWIQDDFHDAPVLAETPGSVFGALPVALAHGYTHLCVAHERSADKGNLVWEHTGEEVNHQWGKSLQAEVLLQRYIARELVANVTYSSVLKPLSDVAIFADLTEHGAAVRDAHSCNVAKPWCERCAKCAYVWINYQAHLDPRVLDGMFASNLLDADANQPWFRQMLGFEQHTPFECIGEVGEARLAFELARRRGVRGRAMDTFVSGVPPVDVPALAEHYLTVDPAHHAMPAGLAERVVPHLTAVGARARERLNA